MSAFDGGNAFPVALENNTSNSITGFHGETLEPGSRSVYGGMSLRDYFAAKVDVSVYTPFNNLKEMNGRNPTVGELAEYISGIRYIEADLMLAERAK